MCLKGCSRRRKRSDNIFSNENSIENYDSELWKSFQNEAKRQEDHIELIASENYASKRILEAQGSVLTNKYAEGYPSKRYYGGCENVDVAENLAIDRAKELFKADYANVQPHSGSSANAAAYLALLEPNDTILGMSLDHGGHLTHGSKVNFSGRNYKSVQYGLHPETNDINYDEVNNLREFASLYIKTGPGGVRIERQNEEGTWFPQRFTTEFIYTTDNFISTGGEILELPLSYPSWGAKVAFRISGNLEQIKFLDTLTSSSFNTHWHNEVTTPFTPIVGEPKTVIVNGMSSITSTEDMFVNAGSSLTNIDVGEFDTSNVTNMVRMFKDVQVLGDKSKIHSLSLTNSPKFIQIYPTSPKTKST